MAELIGVGRCPIGCGSTKARYTLTVKNLACGTCNACNTQVFARSDRSDEVLRANIIPATAPAPEPSPLAIADDAAGPIADSDDAGQPAKPPAATPPPPPAKQTNGWGLLAYLEK